MLDIKEATSALRKPVANEAAKRIEKEVGGCIRKKKKKMEEIIQQ
jgi:hypothetical protein